MPLFRLAKHAMEALRETTFAAEGIRERDDIQRLLRTNIEVIADDVLLIAEEFSEWDDSKRRIDLLGVDSDANLVVIELKRGEEGGWMELQALRYAAMVSHMTFSQAVDAHQVFLDEHSPGQDARQRLLDHLGWDEPRDDEFARDVRIVLVAADFSKELTTSALWLLERDLDIRCVRLKPYRSGEDIVIDAQQVLPLPEAEDYQVRVREKAINQREAARKAGAKTGYWFMNTGDGSNDSRCWEDCKQYCFLTAGGGEHWIRKIQSLKPGDRVFAYLSGHGYVGLAEVLAEAVPVRDFVPPGQPSRLADLPVRAALNRARMNSLDRCDWCVAVRWIHAVDRDHAVLKNRARRSTLEQIRQESLVAELLERFSPG